VNAHNETRKSLRARLFEIARVLVHLNHVARLIQNSDGSTIDPL
jgi:hypothetical protein